MRPWSPRNPLTVLGRASLGTATSEHGEASSTRVPPVCPWDLAVLLPDRDLTAVFPCVRPQTCIRMTRAALFPAPPHRVPGGTGRVRMCGGYRGGGGRNAASELNGTEQR